VAIRLVVRAGSAFDPPDRLGVGDFALRLMRRGAAGMTADQISDRVEFVGASVGGFANEENGVMSLSTPSQHLEQMFEIFTQIVRQPDFHPAEVELARRRTLAQFANELDDPGSLADRALVRSMWGDHPYVREAVIGKHEIEKITREDLVKFHQTRLGPKIAHLYVAGEFKVEQVMKLIEKGFGSWSGGPEALPSIPEWSGVARPGEVIIVDKPEQTQAQLRIGAAGVKRGHPDHFPLMVMNTVLGGGFTSRLVNEIRVKRSLSYGAGCSFEMMSAAGTFTLSSFTKTKTVNELIDVSLAEVRKMKSKGPTDREVATVQRYISGLYPARLETNEAIAGAIADVVHYGLTDAWISHYRERIAQVTVKEAAAAAKAHLFDGSRAIILVGNAAALKPLVAKYGKVTVMQPTELE
jgi:zinc protease